jgi:hypothetical protein
MLRYPRAGKNLVTTSAHLLRREIALSLIFLLAAPLGGSVSVFAQQTVPSQQAGGVSSSQTSPQSPEIAKPAADSSSANLDNQQQSNAPKAAQAPQENGNQAPLGTAVAPYEKGIGVAASRPAGAVIAPAKQRRSRSFLIKVGVLIGAAVAVGTVVALSNASPSHPTNRESKPENNGGSIHDAYKF